MFPVIAVDFGGTHIRTALFDSDSMHPSRQTKIKTLANEGPEPVIERIKEAIEAVLPSDQSGLRIGIASPGPLDPYKGTIFFTPNLPGWNDIPLAQDIADHFHCPTVINNDANLAALGEWKYGAGKGVNDLIYLTISTGIGGGVITHGHLLLGAHGLAAELGHMTVVPDGPLCGCGKHGHLEAIASGPSIARIAGERLKAGEPSILHERLMDLDNLDAEVIAEAAREGDSLSLSVIEDAGKAIGNHLGDLVHAFNPARIIIGGGVSQMGEDLFEPIRKGLRETVMHPIYLLDLEVKAAELGDDVGLIGAMVLARQG
jgi:glucokinase